MKRVGLVGWRGMVGSVLMQRMLEEQDFDLIEPVFFTTSNVGGQGPSVGKDIAPLKDAYNIEELKTLDVILTCQGGDYTSEVFPKLREAGWQGYWIDAASTLRMQDDAVIILDPVYRKVYRDVITPERVAELLMLRADMPRSLLASMQEVVDNLALVANEQSGETQRKAGRLLADLRYARIDEILATGLHAYLTQFLERVNALGADISRDFLVPN